MKVLITGSKGQLGLEFVRYIKGKADVSGIDKEDLDITDQEKVFSCISSISPDIVIHCAAYTNVDSAETERDAAYSVNVLGTRNIAEAANKCGAKLVYISTDYVFSGDKKTPYIETDKTGPLNYYGETKLLGEKAVQELLHRYFIVRSSWLYNNEGMNFVKTMIKLAQTQDCINVVDDQIGTPTYVQDLVQYIWELIKTESYGIYHISNEGQVSWYVFAKKIIQHKGLQAAIMPVSTEQFNRPAKRPAYSVLSKDKFRGVTGKSPKGWEEALIECLNKGI